MIKEVLLSVALLGSHNAPVVIFEEETPIVEETPTDPETPETGDTSLTGDEEKEVGEELGVSEEEQEKTKEEIIAKFKEFAGQYLNAQTLANIIQYAVDTGIISILAFVYAKYRKYKSKSSEEISKEVLNAIQEEAKKGIAELNKEQLEELQGNITQLENALNTLTKVTILAQDKTAEGKKAVLDALIESSKSEEVKELGEEKKEKIAEEVKVEQKIKEDIKEDYNPID